MGSSTPKIRPTRPDDLTDISATFKGLTIEIDGKAEGVVGLLYVSPIQVISWASDRVKRHPRVVVMVMRKIQAMINNVGVPVYAVADVNEPTSHSLLSHAGFRRVRDNIYVWGE